jgi:hypothetical protein
LTALDYDAIAESYAPSLRALCEAVEEAEDFIYKNDLGALDSYLETSNLPTFGGEEPKKIRPRSGHGTRTN